MRKVLTHLLKKIITKSQCFDMSCFFCLLNDLLPMFITGKNSALKFKTVRGNQCAKAAYDKRKSVK